MIHFCAINEERFDNIVKMKKSDNDRFVAPNSVSLAQAWLYREDDDVFPFAICDDDLVVGFMMLEEDRDEQKLWLWRIVIDQEQEGNGYATAATKLLIQLARESGKYSGLYLDCAVESTIARHIYDRLGFVSTGEINHGDVEMCIHFG